jgi:Rrf2 family protein
VKIALGRKGDYSVRAVLDLSLHYRKGRRKAHEIATSMRIPENYLPRILADLVRAGLISATAGRDGGYELRRPPSQICLLDVVDAAEGVTEIRTCVLRGIPCDKDDSCAVHEAWSAAQTAMTQQLRKTTFSELARRQRASSVQASKRPKNKA